MPLLVVLASGYCSAPGEPVAPEKAKVPKEATPASEAATPRLPRKGSKEAIVFDILKNSDGATLDSIVATTGWQKKTVYGFISGTSGAKMVLTVESFKRSDGARAYRVSV